MPLGPRRKGRSPCSLFADGQSQAAGGKSGRLQQRCLRPFRASDSNQRTNQPNQFSNELVWLAPFQIHQLEKNTHKKKRCRRKSSASAPRRSPGPTFFFVVSLFFL